MRYQSLNKDRQYSAASGKLPDQPIVVFDGVCNFCSRSVRFVLNNDKTESILFAPMQSEVGARLMEHYGIDPAEANTFLFVSGGGAYVRSSAALEVARYFGFWKVLRVFKVIPPSWRDSCYAVLAKNRYKWFGKLDHCYLPTEKERSRFVDTAT